MLAAQAASAVHTYSFVLRVRHEWRTHVRTAHRRLLRGKRVQALPRRAPLGIGEVQAARRRALCCIARVPTRRTL